MNPANAEPIPAHRPLHLPAHVGGGSYGTAVQAARALAERVGDLLRSALESRERASLVVSGGRSPVAFMEVLSQQALDWAKVYVTLADERWVPPDDPDSNAGLVRSALLQGKAATARFVALYGGEATPEAGVASCTERLSRMMRPFDVMVLGMGEDGHTASLFPESAELEGLLAPDAAPVGAVRPPHAPHARISMSLPGLLDSRVVFILISGPRKREVIERACAQANPLSKPIAAVLMQFRTPVEVFYGATD